MAVLLGLVVVAMLALPMGTASADPSLSDAKKKLHKLNSKVDKLDDEYNKIKQDWKKAKTKLKALNKQVDREKKTYKRLHTRVAQMAATAYKRGDVGAVPRLAAAKNPQAVLDQMSVLAQISRDRTSELAQFVASAQRLQREQAEAKQAYDDVAKKKKDLHQQEKKLEKSIDKQKELIGELGGYDTPSTGSGGTGGTYNGPASGPAKKALDYAYAQLGKPYVYGGEGPNGYDCSGLTMMSWRAAGVSLPRVVPDQYNATHRVSKSNLRPGDLVFFDGLGHVGIYVGNGKFIHAPHTGTVVQIASLGNSWYSSHYVGAGRP